MSNIHKYFNLKIMIVFFIFCSGCNSIYSEGEKVDLKIAAASDLSLAFTEVGELFEEETGSKVVFSFGSTGQLADQIENGAPFDVFAAANIQFIENLIDKDLVLPNTQTSYAFGRVGIGSPLESSISIETLEDLLKPEVKKIAIANPEHAPYGLAAKQALESAGVWKEVEKKLVYGRNISDTLALIETGNVEVGIIALSIYKEDDIDFILIDSGMHTPLEQSIAVLNRTKHAELAKEFIEFIKGPIGGPIMESYGFVVPEVK